MSQFSTLKISDECEFTLGVTWWNVSTNSFLDFRFSGKCNNLSKDGMGRTNGNLKMLSVRWHLNHVELSRDHVRNHASYCAASRMCHVSHCHTDNITTSYHTDIIWCLILKWSWSNQGWDGRYNKLTNGFIFFPIQARSQRRNIEYFKTQLRLTN